MSLQSRRDQLLLGLAFGLRTWHVYVLNSKHGSWKERFVWYVP